jgi:hypothetical protein
MAEIIVGEPEGLSKPQSAPMADEFNANSWSDEGKPEPNLAEE